MLTVQNAQILSDHEQAILQMGMVIAAAEWDKLAPDMDKVGMKSDFEGYAKKARELALNCMSAQYVIFDQGMDEVSSPGNGE